MHRMPGAGPKNPDPPDQRLAPIANPDGSLSRDKVETLLSRPPQTLTIPELEAMQVLIADGSPHLPASQDDTSHPLVGLTYPPGWHEAFIRVTGGSITREKVRHGEVVDRSVRRYRGRPDVRRFRAQHQATTGGSGPVRARAREYRPAANRRTASSSETSSSDPGSDSDSPGPPLRRQCAAPWCTHPVIGSAKRYCGTERCNQARAKERKRQSRRLADVDVDVVELERREALEQARLAGYIGHKAFAGRGEHSLSFLWGTRWNPQRIVEGDDPGEFEALSDVSLRTCRCNGHHIDGGAVGCFRCGMPREAVPA
jgi:hypothetical protein